MKFLSVRDLKTKSSQVWKDLPEQKEMIVTSNGRPIALLSSINENNLEQVLTAFRHARATNAVATVQYESAQKGKDLKKVLERIEALAADPRPPGCEKLTGQQRYRLRQGRYRILYSIQDDELTVWVVKVGHRKDIYR